MPTDFATSLHRYLTSHLAGLKGASPNTIASYRDTFKHLICYLRDHKAIPPEKLTFAQIDTQTVTGFLNWLEDTRHNTASTRNQRLSAIHAFYGWMQAQDPTLLARCQSILAIPVKRHEQTSVHHLSVEQTRGLLAAPDRNTCSGRRDATLLATLYDTGARVQELIDLTIHDVRLQQPAIIALTGKGRKTRHVPLVGNTVALLDTYMTEHHLNAPGRETYPVFYNQRHLKLSRGGIAWIIRKYQAQTSDLSLTNVKISPHTMRHSKAMHLYEAGIPLPYIRDILGHVDLSTTDIYARASTEAKRKALESAYADVVSADMPEWNQDKGLLDWLQKL